jgi:pilus assembly protein TadC
MTKEELIDKILSDLYLNSNRAMDFYEDFSVYDNDVNRLDEVRSEMEREGLIKEYKNRKTGITPLGFKICFEGGYLEEKIRKERQIRQTFHKNKKEIAFLKKKIRAKNRLNTFLLIFLLLSLSLVVLMALGKIDLSIKLPY